MQCLDELKNTIYEKRAEMPAGHAMLVGISGIDASGKGFIANKLAEWLEGAGFRVALINIDGWLNLPRVRFSEIHPDRHFYQYALRLDDAFERLILPLKLHREVDIVIDHADETAIEFVPRRHIYSGIDIVLVEGIFIFKQAYIRHFDLKIWVDCAFEIALTRAVGRRQEGLDAGATVSAYQTIYFPAQKHHLAVDDPVSHCDLIIENE
jgi:uridine kinase